MTNKELGDLSPKSDLLSAQRQISIVKRPNCIMLMDNSVTLMEGVYLKRIPDNK